MTHQDYEASDGLPPEHDDLGDAVRSYIDKFGQGPAVFQFEGHIPALIRELRAAVARGEPLTEAETYRRLGMTPPPPDAIL